MGYQALLFCPDEKTARTVTQVLGDLEFSVETCAEPFAAVKKLMSQHFDALVVDCDNEQNATLLFKSARNSTSNQASLAVAVVEGQAGVAKAFRIGANLVLTKPINVEQAKGTLRVARGLLRKGEPGKPAAAATSAAVGSSPAAPAAAKPVAPKAASPQPVAPPKPVAPTAVASSANMGARSPLPPVPKPTASPLPPRAAAASAAPPSAASDDDLLDINIDDSHAAPAAQAPPAMRLPPQISSPMAESKPAAKPVVSAPAFGSAAAAAPAREVQPAPAVTEPEPLAQSEVSHSESKSAPEAPFTFGGATTEAEPGPNNKVLIGIAAAVIALVGIYFGWSYISSSSSRTPANPTPVTASQPVNSAPAPSKPAATATSQPAASAPSSQPVSQQAASQPSATSPSTKHEASADSSDANDVTVTYPEEKAASKPATPSKPAAAPLVVKGGVAPSIKKAPTTADAPAPSMIGLATPNTSAATINMVSNSNEPKPVLQTLNISQGVSQGLLIKKVQPTYPQNAMAMHVEGAVNLLATISKSGSITQVKVLGGPSLLIHAAADAVKQWKYKPYLLNGEPVEIQTQITVNFKLP